MSDIGDNWVEIAGSMLRHAVAAANAEIGEATYSNDIAYSDSLGIFTLSHIHHPTPEIQIAMRGNEISVSPADTEADWRDCVVCSGGDAGQQQAAIAKALVHYNKEKSPMPG